MIKFFSKLQQRFFKHLAEIRAWDTRNWKAPAPHFIKQARLLEQGLANATWVETGTVPEIRHLSFLKRLNTYIL